MTTCCAAHIVETNIFQKKLTYTEGCQYTHCTLPHAYQGINICPVQTIVSNVKINGQGFLDAFQWHTLHSVRRQWHSLDLWLTGKQQESFGDNALLAIVNEFEAHGASTLGALWCVEAQVTAVTIVSCTRIGTWKTTSNLTTWYNVWENHMCGLPANYSIIQCLGAVYNLQTCLSWVPEPHTMQRPLLVSILQL